MLRCATGNSDRLGERLRARDLGQHLPLARARHVERVEIGLDLGVAAREQLQLLDRVVDCIVEGSETGGRIGHRAATISTCRLLRGEERDESILGQAGRPGRNGRPVLDHGKRDLSVNEAGEAAGEIGCPGLAANRSPQRHEPVREGAARSGDRERADERRGDDGVSQSRPARCRREHAS